MKNLVERLAYLSGLRDREKLDFALVLLVRALSGDTQASVRLVRLAGIKSDQRWLMCAQLSPACAEPERDKSWVDWESLPTQDAYPESLACLQAGKIMCLEVHPRRTLFPVCVGDAADALIELETKEALSAEQLCIVAGVLQIYRNVQGLLDYGEKDSLTDLLNRKTFDAAFLNVSMQHADTQPLNHPDRRADVKGAYWLAVLDIDHFKRVNDTYGHLVGDEVLLLFARLMRSKFRQHDQLYRFGGEEFVVLMRCATALDARAATERFRAAVAAHVFPQVGSITVSIGYTRLTPDDTPGSGFDRADKAVYYAKGNGRNQVQSYSDLVESGAIAEESIQTQETDFF
ncbi:MAG: GGDEF domain-containing protein [Burkholderiales bacterium PBB4]|nr:MAG: GGDEF domain-containing protein [Burkholderiales bacterium PBB4]